MRASADIAYRKEVEDRKLSKTCELRAKLVPPTMLSTKFVYFRFHRDRQTYQFTERIMKTAYPGFQRLPLHLKTLFSPRSD